MKGKRKKFLFIIGISICFLAYCDQTSTKVVGDYDVSKLSSDFGNNKAYEIGANAAGKPIFKDNNKALKQAKIDYKEGFDAIAQEFDLQPVSKENYKDYMTLGWQLTIEDRTVRQKGIDISKFFDIYENSF